MAATSLHNDVLLDSEECHERPAHCSFAHLDSLVGRVAGARGVGMLPTGEMEELIVQCGTY